MIRDHDGNRMTPKQKAQDLIMDSIRSVVMYRLAEDDDEMTDRERDAVESQIVKQKERVEKFFGYEQGSWDFG